MKYLIIILVLVVLSGCVVTKEVPATLYNTETSEVINLNLNLKAELQTHHNGTVKFTMPDGENYTGRYNTNLGGYKTYGSHSGKIYNQYDRVNYSGSSRYNTMPNTFNGLLIGMGDKGSKLTCNYAVSRTGTSLHGQGICNDNNSNKYEILF